MQEFSIKDLESFTGIKAGTIRIWEQRYGILEPKRTSTNIRYYTDKDLKKLLNVSVLAELGYKISRIAGMPEQEMQKIIREANNVDTKEQHYLNMLKISMLNYDEELFYSVANSYIDENGVEATFVKLFMPFMTQVGILWLTSAICPAQEHFISNLIRQKIFSLIDGMEGRYDVADKLFVMYLPTGEIHDISLLLIHYMAKARGYRSIFLGQSVPFEDLLQVVKKYAGVTFVSYSTTSPSTKHVKQYLDRIVREFAQYDCTFHLAGRTLSEVEAESDRFIKVYKNGQELIRSIFA
ncbi:MAG: MerR family transcriptional regulator [Flavobacteriales bacterium]|nr:MerR family transcriptional regulator [Flavobacteriales bacterium]